MTPRDPRISVYPSHRSPGQWTWTITGCSVGGRWFGYLGDSLTEPMAWRAAENALLVCDPPARAKAAA